jgi:chromate reductase, NAD(P)H dehydrogenase (quinone)
MRVESPSASRRALPGETASRVLAISGSLRRESYNRRLLLEAAELLPPGTELELYEELKSVPPYDEDDDTGSEAGARKADAVVRRLRDAVSRADAILVATPEYNSSVPGQLKNAIDWASRPRGAPAILGKPVAVIGTGTGSFGGVWAQAELRKVLRTAGARVVEGEVSVPRAHVRLAEDGRLLDDELRERTQVLLDELLAEVRPGELVAAA